MCATTKIIAKNLNKKTESQHVNQTIKNTITVVNHKHGTIRLFFSYTVRMFAKIIHFFFSYLQVGHASIAPECSSGLGSGHVVLPILAEVESQLCPRVSRNMSKREFSRFPTLGSGKNSTVF
jgi:hypothetical protein